MTFPVTPFPEGVAGDGGAPGATRRPAPSRRRGLRLLGLCLAWAPALAAGATARLAAQEPPPEPGDAVAPASPSAYLTAFAGLLAPLSDLTSDQASFATALTVSGVVGSEAAVWLGRHWGIGIQALYAPGELETRPTEFQGAVPGELGDADYLAATAAVVYRLAPGGAAAVLEPYFGVGGGIRYLDVQPIAEPEVEDVTNALGTVMGGAYAAVSRRFAVRVEVRDLVSLHESPSTGDARVQNDITVTVGLATALY